MSVQRSSRRLRVGPPARNPMLIVWGAVAVLVGVGLVVLIANMRPRERARRPRPPATAQEDRAATPETPVTEPKLAGPAEADGAPAPSGERRAFSAAQGGARRTGRATWPVSAEKAAKAEEKDRPKAPTESLSAIIDGLAGDGLVRSAEAQGGRPAADDAGFGLPLPQAAERTAGAIRKAVAAGVAEGRHETIHIELAGAPKRGKVTGADEKGIQLSLTGVTVPMAWDKIDARRLYFLGRKYLPAAAGSAEEKAKTRLRLARYCVANELFDEAREELTKALQADLGMRSSEILIATEELLREGRTAARGERARAPVVSRKRGLTPCYKCGGTGIMHWMSCPQCDRSDRPGYCYFGEYYTICNRCKGKGKLPGIRCDMCGGRGKTDPDRPLKRERHVPKGRMLCPHCAGTGVEHWIKCIQCKRSGFPGYLFMGDHYLICNRCKGAGKIPGIKCSRCRGSGMIREQR